MNETSMLVVAEIDFDYWGVFHRDYSCVLKESEIVTLRMVAITKSIV